MESKVLEMQYIVKGEDGSPIYDENGKPKIGKKEFDVRFSLRNIIWLERQVKMPIGQFFNEDMKEGKATLSDLFTFVQAGLSHKDQGINDLDHLIEMIDEHSEIEGNSMNDIIDACMYAIENSSTFKDLSDDEEQSTLEAVEEDEKKP